MKRFGGGGSLCLLGGCWLQLRETWRKATVIKLQGREILLWQQNVFSWRKMSVKKEIRSIGNWKEVQIPQKDRIWFEKIQIVIVSISVIIFYDTNKFLLSRLLWHLLWKNFRALDKYERILIDSRKGMQSYPSVAHPTGTQPSITWEVCDINFHRISIFKQMFLQCRYEAVPECYRSAGL